MCGPAVGGSWGVGAGERELGSWGVGQLSVAACEHLGGVGKLRTFQDEMLVH